jgi:Holliday junction resolvase
MTPEAKVKKKVKATLDAMGVYHFPPFSGGYGHAGVPDIVGCYKGIFLGIECKANGNKTTAIQKFNLERIKSCGGVSLIVDEGNVDQLREIINHEIQNRG